MENSAELTVCHKRSGDFSIELDADFRAKFKEMKDEDFVEEVWDGIECQYVPDEFKEIFQEEDFKCGHQHQDTSNRMTNEDRLREQ